MANESYPSHVERTELETEINNAVIELVACQRLVNAGLPLEDFQDDIDYHLRILEYCLSGEEVCVSGSLIIPDCDERGNVTGLAKAEGAVVGQFVKVGCEILQTEGSDDSYLEIGVCVTSGGVYTDSVVDASDIEYRTFAPLDSSTFYIYEDSENLLPEEDNEIAQEIDIYLLNSPVDFAGLANYVNSKFKTMKSDLEREYYTSYINSLASFEQVTMLSHRIHALESDIIKHSSYDEPFVIDGMFGGFCLVEIIKANNPKNLAQDYKLAMIVWDESGETKSINIDEILAIELH